MKKEIHLTQDSICALATPVGSGCRGVVRITGPDTFRLLEKIPGLEIPQIDSSKKTSHSLKLMFGNGSGLVCRALVWHGSSSYTGQNVVELHLVNNSFILDKVIGWLISAGFRKAIPGEFTLRAFLSGKIDFTQVDAIHQIIEAESFTDLEKALGKLGGGIVNPLKVLKDDLVNMLADIEANLDFSQEDIQFIANDEVVRRLSGLLAQVINIHRKMTGRSERKKVFKVLLAGVPNSGKSSLMNALTGEVASLVSSVEGTTRDYVVKRLAWKGFEFDLVDAPGWEKPRDDIENDAQKLLVEELKQADLIVACSCGSDCSWAEHFLKSYPAKLVHVATKTDVYSSLPGVLATSALNKVGLMNLKNRIVEELADLGGQQFSPLAHLEGLCAKVVESLKRAHQSAIFQEPMEMLALDLRESIQFLGEITGQVFTEDLLDRMFSRFCVGK